MSEVEITIGGRKYSIACNPGEESEVLAASEELDLEAKNIVNSVGKVSDVKLLLMAGLMLGGRIKSFEKNLNIKSNEISELQKSLSSLNEKKQELLAESKNSIIQNEIQNIKNISEDYDFEKVLKSIHEKLLDILVDNKNLTIDNNQNNEIDKSDSISSDQKELF